MIHYYYHYYHQNDNYPTQLVYLGECAGLTLRLADRPASCRPLGWSSARPANGQPFFYGSIITNMH